MSSLALVGLESVPYLQAMRLIASPVAISLLLAVLFVFARKIRHPEWRTLPAFLVLAFFVLAAPGALAALAISALASLQMRAEPWAMWVTLVALHGLFAITVLWGWNYGSQVVSRPRSRVSA